MVTLAQLTKKTVFGLVIALLLGTFVGIGMVVADSSEQEGDCTYTIGYWKNHEDAWPVDSLTVGGVTYTKAEALVILESPPKGDATYILSHQLIGAMLNVFNGADPSQVEDEIDAANAWLVDNPLGSDPDDPDRAEGIALSETLDAYNNGDIGPGHCDDGGGGGNGGPVCTSGYASQVVEYRVGRNNVGGPVDPEYTDPLNALGEPQNDDTLNFVSLGFGGVLYLKFEVPFNNGPDADLRVVETTYGSPACEAYPERVRVYASQDMGAWMYLGTGCLDSEFDLGALDWAQYVRLEDASHPNDFGGIVDGFDVDGVEATCVLAYNSGGDPPPPPPLELLTNGGFEIDDDGDKLPDSWTGVRLNGSKQKCNKPEKDKYYSHSGDCAFMFKGDFDEKTAKLKQVILDLNGIAGSNFSFSVWARGKNVLSTANAQAVVVVHYTDGTKEKVKVVFDKGTYDYKEFTATFAAAKDYDKIKVVFKFNAPIGSKLFLDDASLLQLD